MIHFIVRAAEGSIATVADFGDIFSNVVSYLLGFVAIVLFILLIIGGFKFITAGSDPKAAESAKKTLTSALAGLMIILLSYIILALITRITGVDVTSFKILI